MIFINLSTHLPAHLPARRTFPSYLFSSLLYLPASLSSFLPSLPPFSFIFFLSFLPSHLLLLLFLLPSLPPSFLPISFLPSSLPPSFLPTSFLSYIIIGLLLEIPSIKSKKTLGDRSFKMAAPAVWNNLPYNLRNGTNFNKFKSSLKTYFLI